MNTLVVVDDDPVFSRLIKTVFELEGYQVELVPRPDDVLPKVRQQKPMLILMDVHSGHGDTFDVLQGLRAEEELKTVPVVMTSGVDHSARCLEDGADAFILKPFRPGELTKLVADLVSRQAA